MTFFRKKKAQRNDEMKGYNEEKLQKTEFMSEQKVKTINDEIDRVFRESPLKIQYPTLEEFADAIRNEKEFKLD